MAVDKFFKSLERRTERDLYRKAFKTTMKSQKDLYSAVSGGVKKEKRKKIAMEVLWFFLSVIIGFVVGYTIYELLYSFSSKLIYNLKAFLNFKTIEMIYLFSLVSFIGVYLTRLTIWTLKLTTE